MAAPQPTKWDQFLRTYGLIECGECKSWVYDTPDAKAFHFRRCSGGKEDSNV